MKQSWLHFRGSNTLKARRNSYHRLAGKHSVVSRKAVTLNRMSRSFDDSYEEKPVSSSKSQQDFIDMLSQVQGRRYDNQRSPYPSPTLSKQSDSVDYVMSNGELEEEVTIITTPTSITVSEEGSSTTILEENESLHSSSCDSITIASLCSPNHFRPSIFTSPGSPRLKPNRRSVEALRMLLKTEEAPFPLIINPPDGGYWVQNGEFYGSKGPDGMWRAPEIDIEHFRVDTDNTALMYGCHFVGKNHKNFYATDGRLGPLIFSLMFDSSSSFDPMIRMILRTQNETLYRVYPSAQLSRKLEPEEYLTILSAQLKNGENMRVENLKRVQHPNANELIQKFDEHCVARQHKVGIIYQRYGQTTEEEMFCNNDHSPAFKEFVELLGDTVTLKGFDKYRGGLDNCHNQTGETSVYTEYEGQEIMFHVSTLLPFDSTDRQQVARKRHIGNDIVLVVFQDSNTPYSPDCVRSRFLHAHIVVQTEQPCTDNTVYKVAVAAKNQVPDFTPPLPIPGVFAKGNDFREWLLTKILNAESQCYKAPDFERLANRTRTQLFSHLIKDLASSKDDIDSSLPILDKRKSLAFDTYEANQSPRRRRMTFGSIFPRRKTSVTPSPKLSPRKFSMVNNTPRHHPSKKFTTSTPDLTRINSEDDSLSNGSQTMDRRKPEKIKSQGKSKRFTLHGRSRKKSQQVMMDHEDDVQLRNDKNIVYPSTRSSLRTSLNWSVPSDLPAVITQQMPTGMPSGPTSLENLAISLEPDITTTNLDRLRCASNPDIIDERRRSRKLRPRIPSEFYSVSDIQRSPGSAGPRTCDVAIQVDSKQVFTFPTPPNSVSPTLPIDPSQLTSPQHTHIGLPQHTLFHSHKQNSNHAKQTNQDGGSHHSPSNSIDNRQSSGSFPFVPEEDEEIVDHIDEDKEDEDRKKRSLLLTSSSATEVIQEEEGDGSFGDSSDDMENDSTYQTLVNNIQLLTQDVAKLQNNQMKLYRENTHMALNIQKWKAKCKFAKAELLKKDEIISSLQEQLTTMSSSTPEQKERRLSEIGTTL